MRKIVRLTEQDLVRLVNKVISEQSSKSPSDKGDTGIHGFFNKIKNVLIKKGYNKVPATDPTFSWISLAKGKNRVETMIEDGKSFIALNKNNHPNYEVTKIYTDGLKDINGPYKVEYYTVKYEDNPKLIKTENLNAGEVLQLIQSSM
jgi:hypothetical protein